jgi:hypothetical protein
MVLGISSLVQNGSDLTPQTAARREGENDKPPRSRTTGLPADHPDLDLAVAETVPDDYSLGGSGHDCCKLVRLSASLFSGTLSRQGLLHSALRTWLQIEGVALHFSNDVFRLNLALEATESVVY